MKNTHSSGRPPALTPEEHSALIDTYNSRFLRTNLNTASESLRIMVYETMGKEVSAYTLRRYLKKPVTIDGHTKAAALPKRNQIAPLPHRDLERIELMRVADLSLSEMLRRLQHSDSKAIGRYALESQLELIPSEVKSAVADWVRTFFVSKFKVTDLRTTNFQQLAESRNHDVNSFVAKTILNTAPVANPGDVMVWATLNGRLEDLAPYLPKPKGKITKTRFSRIMGDTGFLKLDHLAQITGFDLKALQGASLFESRGRPPIPDAIKARVREFRATGKTYKQCAEEFSLSISTIQRICKETSKDTPDEISADLEDCRRKLLHDFCGEEGYVNSQSWTQESFEAALAAAYDYNKPYHDLKEEMREALGLVPQTQGNFDPLLALKIDLSSEEVFDNLRWEVVDELEAADTEVDLDQIQHMLLEELSLKEIKNLDPQLPESMLSRAKSNVVIRIREEQGTL